MRQIAILCDAVEGSPYEIRAVGCDYRLPLLLGDEPSENLTKTLGLWRVQECLRLINQNDGV